MNESVFGTLSGFRGFAVEPIFVVSPLTGINPAYKEKAMAWGLFCTLPNATTVWLEQISGGGRILVRRGKAAWWGPAPPGALWSAYSTDQGQTYETKEEAEEVAARLNASGIESATTAGRGPQDESPPEGGRPA